ncbi:hypothetical protein DH09_02360 [Bacillaceae bacterium JMAK1]|nr:hypothetical protein DH09_02360 [Bacillaceae bacterium JMAK1]
MCGRFTFFEQLQSLQKHFNIAITAIDEYQESYNVAPTQQVVTVRNDGQQNRLGTLRWGFIPSWSKDPKIGYKMINARGETVHEKNSFRTAFKKRRCIIPASGFYEWKNIDGKKQPYHIQLKNGDPLAFAGLWETWSDKDETIHSCTIITTEANELMRDIHDRMPVILTPADYEAWLDPTITESEYLLSYLEPYPAGDMIAYEVSTDVNSPHNNHANLINSL